MASPVEPISVGELYTQLVSHEQRIEMRGGGCGCHSSVNMAAKGGRNNNNKNSSGSGGRGGGGRSGFGRGYKGGHNGSHPQRNFLSGVYCQLCEKEGHMVVRCFKRFDASFIEPP